MEWQWDRSCAFGSTLAEKPELAPDDGRSYLPQTGGTRHRTGRKWCKRGGWVKKLKHRGWEELDNTHYEISYLIKKLKIKTNPTLNFPSDAVINTKRCVEIVEILRVEAELQDSEFSSSPPPPNPLFHRNQKVCYWITVLLPTLPCYTATKIHRNRSFRSGMHMREFLCPGIRESSLLLTPVAACADAWAGEGGENTAPGVKPGWSSAHPLQLARSSYVKEG